MPVDAPPMKRVVLTLVEGDTTPFASVVDTFVSHFVTCPNAAQHRRQTNA